MALKLTKGALVWVKHPKEAWVPATVSEVLSEDKLRVFYGNGSSDNVKIQFDNPVLRTIGCPGDVELSGMSDMEDSFSDDLTKMTQLITPAVLYTLHKEYRKGKFYSKLGSGTVLALNPFKEVPDLFTVKAIQTYHSVTLSELQNLPAHVYAAAQSALVRLRASVGKVNQSIIVSGESGAGKTWTVCCLMRYLAEVGIEQRHCLSSADHDQSPSKSAYSTPRTSRKQTSNDTSKISPVESHPGIKNGFEENASVARKIILGDSQVNEENNNFNNNSCSDKNMLFPEEMAAGDNVSVSSYRTAENSLGDSYEDFDETLNFNSIQGSVFPSLCDSLDSENFDIDDSDVDLNVSLEIVDRIERRILFSNPILEAFGNACTLRNENSSRFGKYIQLQYDRTGTIVGAQLRTYLLEKTRSVRHDPGERSYHIFYQMMNGANEEQRSSWKLPDIAFPQESVNEKHSAKEQLRYSYDFKETQSSMLKIGINYRMQDNIFKVLSSLLYLRSLTFEGTDDLITPCTLDSTDANIENNLRIASRLLGVHQRLVMEAITFREITAHSNRRKSVFHRPSTVEECKSRRDSLIKFAYDLLFHWIVDRVGESVSAPAGKWCSFIGLLDVYGFESFDHNSLEQLCINYANEKLQQHFVASFLREQQEEYLFEGVTWQHCELTDNVECLNSLELPRNSLFSLLNEECRLNRGNARSGLKSRVESMFHGSKFILQPRISTAEPSFSVVHYAGHVNYQTRDLIEKNKDEVPPEIIQLLASSQNEFVHDLVASTQEDNISPNKAKQRQTVLTRFKESLDDLLETLASTNCHYIRCIKPNKLSQPGVFDSKFVLDQLQACGVVETIRICSPAHPNKISYSEFTARYRFLLRKEAIIIPQVKFETTPSRKKRRCLTNIDMRKEACSRIVRILMERDKTNAAVTEETKEPLQFGKTKVFLSAQLFESLESARSQEIDKCTVTIQRGWRQFAHIRRCREERKRMIAEREKASGLLQRVWRNIIAVRKSRIERHVIIEQRQKSATKMQKCWRLYKRRQKARKERKMMIAKQNNAATTIQSGFRGWRVRCKYRDLMEAWMKLKLIPEEEYRKMVERQLRNLLPPCVISMPSPSYEAIKSSFEIPKIGRTSTPKRHSEHDSGVHTLSSSTKSFDRYPDEKFSVYYDSRASRNVGLRESIIHDDLDPDEEFDLQTFEKLRISPKRSSPYSKDSDSDVEPPLRSSGGIRHAKIVRSSGSLNRSKVATSMIKELERSRSMPRLVRGPGVIYAWHNRATISMMTPKRPLSLSSDPLTLLEMQYNRSSSVLTTPLPNLRLSKKHSRNRHRRSRHQRSPQNLSYSEHNLSLMSFNRFSPSRSAMNTCSLNQFGAMSRSGSNCILKHADVKPKFI